MAQDIHLANNFQLAALMAILVLQTIRRISFRVALMSMAQELQSARNILVPLMDMVSRAALPAWAPVSNGVRRVASIIMVSLMAQELHSVNNHFRRVLASLMVSRVFPHPTTRHLFSTTTATSATTTDYKDSVETPPHRWRKKRREAISP